MNGIRHVAVRMQVRVRGGARILARLRGRVAAVRRRYRGLPSEKYRSIIASRVARLVLQPITEFDLYRSCLGAFPAIVQASLFNLSYGQGGGSPTSRGAKPELFEPAPWEQEEFDFIEAEWYFDVPSVAHIISLFPATTASVVSLGTPTVAAGAARRIRDVTLLDRSAALAHRHLGSRPDDARATPRIVQWDLSEKPQPDVSHADVVVLDPPWYIEHYRAWLHTAVAACKTGGLIILALPQLLTNRRTLPERDELIEILKGIGDLEIEKDVLSYVTPSFERAVLEISGLDHLVRWRRADLAVVQVRQRDLPFRFDAVTDIPWAYREVSGRILRTRDERNKADSIPVLESPNAEHPYRLTSVSRNALRDSRINLVTSRGRSAVVTHWGSLPEILDLRQDGITLKKAIVYALPSASVQERARVLSILRTLLER